MFPCVGIVKQDVSQLGYSEIAKQDVAQIDDYEIIFLIPWGHMIQIINKCKAD